MQTIHATVKSTIPKTYTVILEDRSGSLTKEAVMEFDDYGILQTIETNELNIPNFQVASLGTSAFHKCIDKLRQEATENEREGYTIRDRQCSTELFLSEPVSDHEKA